MRRLALAALVVVCCSTLVRADVRTQEKSQVTLGGTLGRIAGFFGGKAAREGVVTTVAVKGNRMMRTSDAGAQIVDLDEEKVYDINRRGRSYTVTTFAELRRRMEEQQRKAQQQAPPAGAGGPAGEPAQGKEMQIDVSLKQTGQTRRINAFDTREVVMTITMHEKGKPIEDSGGLVLTSDMWMAPKIAAMDEIANFERRYYEKLGLPVMLDAQQMAAVSALYPMVKDAIGRMQTENVKLTGTPVLTDVTIEGVQSAEQRATADRQPEDPPPTSLGGLGGRLGRKLLSRRTKDADASSAAGRSMVMKTTHELLEVTPAATSADVAVPEGFRLKS